MDYVFIVIYGMKYLLTLYIINYKIIFYTVKLLDK